MKSFKKLVAIATAVVVVGATGAVYAATIKTPAEITAGLTGKSTDELYTQRQSGKTYGTIAKEAGKLDEFKAQMLERRKAILDERVKAGTLTQEQADTIYNNMKENQAVCDADGNAGLGMSNGTCASTGSGQGMMGQGRGMRGGFGGGMGVGRGINK